MQTIEELMVELDGADPDTVKRLAREKGSLAVRLAMLGLAAVQKGKNPLWWGYPPGVFIGYKWSGEEMRVLTTTLANQVRSWGYQAFLDTEKLAEDADQYFQIPKFITSLQECVFYVLLLTELSADMIESRKNKTSWITDEYQHAVRLTNQGRLFIVPVLLESNGVINNLGEGKAIDLTTDPFNFEKLAAVLTPNPLRLSAEEVQDLSRVVAQFDELFLNERWDESDELLQRTAYLGHTFDHQFRRMLLSIYTADQAILEIMLGKLYPVYGEQTVHHVYQGYCRAHGIPNRANVAGAQDQ
jgi:hypothetical protein